MASSKKKKENCNSFSEFTSNRRSFSSKSILGISFEGNPEQRELIRLINQNNIPVIYCFGDAGTGKTFTSIAAAIDLVKIQKKYNKIFYIREPLEVGKSLGYLPGSIEEKFEAYCGGLIDNIETISQLSGLNKNDMLSSIECLPPQYTRGRSFLPGSILIIDEAQNLSLDSLHTLLTRFGQFCKVILLGSCNQIDIKGASKENNDFMKSFEILESIDEEVVVGSVTLVQSERSKYCRMIDQAFTKYKENK